MRYVFLDRDGVIIKDKPYIHKIADIEFLPNAIDGLLKIQQLGYQLIIISNQAGVARGYYTLRDAEDFHEEIVHRLTAQGISISKSYLCPHHPDFTGPCDCRKPEIGLAKQAARECGINLKESLFIGDKDSDIQLGENCRGTTFLIKNGQYQTTITPDFVAHNLIEVYNTLQGISR
ncbi:MAG: HAD family hydrolase [bacterium]|nr:HAD family hydrolase [bacterium]